MPYSYDPRLNQGRGGYRDPEGRAVLAERVAGELGKYLDRGEARYMTEMLQQGGMSMTQWQKQMRQLVKDNHLIAYAAERGGWQNMTQSDYGRVGAIVKYHYGRLDDWAQQLHYGVAPRDGRMLARADLYEEAAYSTYAAMDHRSAALAGLTEEFSDLEQSAQNCQGCIEANAMGWQPFGTIPPIGQRDCGARCRCTWRFR
jgi:hypothetical protein